MLEPGSRIQDDKFTAPRFGDRARTNMFVLPETGAQVWRYMLWQGVDDGWMTLSFAISDQQVHRTGRQDGLTIQQALDDLARFERTHDKYPLFEKPDLKINRIAGAHYRNFAALNDYEMDQTGTFHPLHKGAPVSEGVFSLDDFLGIGNRQGQVTQLVAAEGQSQISRLPDVDKKHLAADAAAVCRRLLDGDVLPGCAPGIEERYLEKTDRKYPRLSGHNDSWYGENLTPLKALQGAVKEKDRHLVWSLIRMGTPVFGCYGSMVTVHEKWQVFEHERVSGPNSAGLYSYKCSPNSFKYKKVFPQAIIKQLAQDPQLFFVAFAAALEREQETGDSRQTTEMLCHLARDEAGAVRYRIFADLMDYAPSTVMSQWCKNTFSTAFSALLKNADSMPEAAEFLRKILSFGGDPKFLNKERSLFLDQSITHGWQTGFRLILATGFDPSDDQLMMSALINGRSEMLDVLMDLGLPMGQKYHSISNAYVSLGQMLADHTQEKCEQAYIQLFTHPSYSEPLSKIEPENVHHMLYKLLNAKMDRLLQTMLGHEHFGPVMQQLFTGERRDTYLRTIIENDFTQAPEILSQFGINLDGQIGKQINTASLTLLAGSGEMITAMHKAGIDFNAPDPKGKRPADYARILGNSDKTNRLKAISGAGPA